MDLEIEVEEGRKIVRPHESSLDAFAAHALRMALSAATAGDVRRITVDLSHVEFIDSAGVGALVAFVRQATPTTAVDLEGVRPAVADVLGVAGLSQVFRVATAPEEVVGAIS